ncbi:autotransporter strand-loop-strand O-heptosyltransferase [Rhodoblastus acidophilus]|uniref:Autotransporter strand-loop-strand O-heptosyltransferase n=1 Tax=Candidatus Rhodoblastus alkanivorans TaxID=2954117 RepID=A0ABS9Z9Y4_9HYPH|nr:autotransporter strand-loop-strand O-heptosyltransferase [Candidatus Rhodoblastus alkanivorans]MCI4677155.1 autotransporter strand-loop-strand O-heptosyltransferase [Candidatus Rhodoblastus alkanivorans]MCI4684508.1 autotransporter strand-loop-strand O-heptosyltransferase [Candidatus Rhodoblastus alkanivorans]MDI4641829.1 autotransporter strand-loop-strand O-heptosyltransferase [Rhodoblastus acidophilus]
MDDTNIGAVAKVDNLADGDAAVNGDGAIPAASAQAAARPSSGDASAASDSASVSHFPAPPEIPTQLDACGIRFDFNDGCRAQAPLGADVWRIRLFDLDTGNILFQTTPEFYGGSVRSAKKYYVRFRIEAWKGEKLVFAHDYDASGREVLIAFPVGTLGDTIAWLSYAVRFADKHKCRLTIAMAERLIPLFAGAYPEIQFIDVKASRPEYYYATYRVGLFFDDVERIHQPIDFRHVGLHRAAAHILGLDLAEAPPRLAVQDAGRPIAEKYVVIATQATSQCKYWNNPYGWREIIHFLKAAGYRVICIDQKAVNGAGIVWNHVPAGAEDMTGDMPIEECVRWIRHAEFFVGLSSGLSWLAWAAGAPIVMISGFTLPNTEFETPWRVINYHACVGCWNDPTLRFNHRDFLWCPRHAGTARQFECTSLITAEQVKQAITRIPGFRG